MPDPAVVRRFAALLVRAVSASKTEEANLAEAARILELFAEHMDRRHERELARARDLAREAGDELAAVREEERRRRADLYEETRRLKDRLASLQKKT
jgi:hypothetical protein